VFSSAFVFAILTGLLTHVLYGLYALRVAVNTGRCAVGSQARTPRWRSLSSLGGLSIEYEIHACLTGYSVREFVLALSMFELEMPRKKVAHQPGSICDLSRCQHAYLIDLALRKAPGVLPLTGQTPSPCSPPIVSVLRIVSQFPLLLIRCLARIFHVRGNSSSMFSKYLFP
jgi:hypothetical protein